MSWLSNLFKKKQTNPASWVIYGQAESAINEFAGQVKAQVGRLDPETIKHNIDAEADRAKLKVRKALGL